MSTWKRSENSGLVLDLAPYSPSDGGHAFRYLDIVKTHQSLSTPSVMLNGYSQDLQNTLFHSKTRTNCPGWAKVCSGREPSLEAKRRIFSMVADSQKSHFAGLVRSRGQGKIRKSKARGRLPRVVVITGLRILRRYRRPVSPGILSKLLRESLMKLGWLCYEKWQHIMVKSESSFDQGQLPCFINIWSKLTAF